MKNSLIKTHKQKREGTKKTPITLRPRQTPPRIHVHFSQRITRRSAPSFQDQETALKLSWEFQVTPSGQQNFRQVAFTPILGDKTKEVMKEQGKKKSKFI